MAITHFPLDSTDVDFTGFPCPSCQTPLDFHIPDPDLPNRLLATCEECKTWYLMDVIRREMISLPVREFFDGLPTGERPS